MQIITQGNPHATRIKCDFCGEVAIENHIWFNPVAGDYTAHADGWKKTNNKPAGHTGPANTFDVCPQCQAESA